jgi:hypothetical protein
MLSSTSPMRATGRETLGRDPAAVTVHHGAAAAIGRRGLGMATRRRPAGPRTQLGVLPACGGRMRAGTPPGRPSGQHRSGRTGLTPAH